MADSGNIGIIIATGGLIGNVLAFITFWTRLTDRITIADQKAESAQQESAEAKNDMDDIRKILDEMRREHHDQMEKMRREDGDSLLAIRQKITEVELFMRDHFVRYPDFMAAMAKIDAGQLRTETKLDQIVMRGSSKAAP